jgi:hypothetical protein
MAQPKEIPKQRGTTRLVAGTPEIRAATIEIVSRARRTLAILTPNLEPEIYEHDDFLVALKQFVLARSFSRVRILITEPERAHKPGNQLVHMGQRLSSYIEFRNLAESLRPDSRAYCIADGEAVIYRADYATGDGILAQHSPEIAKLYLSEFDDIWHSS